MILSFCGWAPRCSKRVKLQEHVRPRGIAALAWLQWQQRQPILSEETKNLPLTPESGHFRPGSSRPVLATRHECVGLVVGSRPTKQIHRHAISNCNPSLCRGDTTLPFRHPSVLPGYGLALVEGPSPICCRPSNANAAVALRCLFPLRLFSHYRSIRVCGSDRGATTSFISARAMWRLS